MSEEGPMPNVEISEDLMSQVVEWQRAHKVRRRSEALDALVRRALMIEYAESLGMATPSDEQVLAVGKQQLEEQIAALGA
jgi:hypothetical protein